MKSNNTMYIGDVSTDALPFSGHFRRGRYLFVLHSQHPRGTVQFEQASLMFFLSYCTAHNEKGGGVQARLSFFSLYCSAQYPDGQLKWYGTPAPSSESQHPEAWPASSYGHLGESADIGVCIRFVLEKVWEVYL